MKDENLNLLISGTALTTIQGMGKVDSDELDGPDSRAITIGAYASDE